MLFAGNDTGKGEMEGATGMGERDKMI